MKLFAARLKQACAIGCLLNVACLAAAASPAEPPGSVLTLTQAIEAATTHNPELRATAYELKAADARITQARLRPNPEVSVEIDGIAGKGIAASPDERQTTLSLSQVLELGDKRSWRTAVATSERDIAGIERQARQLDVLAEVTRRFVDVVAAQERLLLARETTALTERTAGTIAIRVKAARTPQAELSRAQIAVTRAHADERQAESILRGAKRSLIAMWGEEAPAFTSAGATLLTLEPLDSFQSLEERINRNPDVMRFASEARLRDAELRLAQSQARPNLTVGLGLRRFQATGDVGLTTGFSMAIPLFDRNQGTIAEARVRRQQADAQERNARIQLRAQLFTIYQQLLSCRDRLAAIQDEALPQARAALEQTQIAYDRGRFSYLELGVAQQELISLRAAAIDIAADYNRLVAEIERLTSQPVIRETAPSELP